MIDLERNDVLVCSSMVRNIDSFGDRFSHEFRRFVSEYWKTAKLSAIFGESIDYFQIRSETESGIVLEPDTLLERHAPGLKAALEVEPSVFNDIDYSFPCQEFQRAIHDLTSVRDHPESSSIRLMLICSLFREFNHGFVFVFSQVVRGLVTDSKTPDDFIDFFIDEFDPGYSTYVATSNEEFATLLRFSHEICDKHLAVFQFLSGLAEHPAGVILQRLKEGKHDLSYYYRVLREEWQMGNFVDLLIQLDSEWRAALAKGLTASECFESTKNVHSQIYRELRESRFYERYVDAISLAVKNLDP